MQTNNNATVATHGTNLSRMASWMQRCAMEARLAREAWEPSAVRFWMQEGAKVRAAMAQHLATYRVRPLPR